ncbi:MAG TPA: thiamine-phosphate kinase, partial [Massilia sp.]|nr:thiamine-phosphate kinase [Massilia sp.]
CELCFAARRADREAVLAAADASGTLVTRVGTIDAEPGLRFVDGSGAPLDLQVGGWDHFSGA